MDLFSLKKFLGVLASPLSICLLLMLIAILFYKAKPKLSFGALIAGFFTLALSSFPPFADKVLYPIEQKYEALNVVPRQSEYVVVLGCAHTSDASLPAINQLKTCSMARMIEAVRIYRKNPQLTIITSGGALFDETSNAQMVKQAAIELGVPAHKIITENFPLDTEEEAQLIAPRVKGKPVIIVTSANHMPRAVKYFEQYGAEVIPAPAQFLVRDYYGEKSWGYYTPQPTALEKTSRAVYESLGQLWQWVKA